MYRVDNVDQASQAKAEIEQKQRTEAETRKENSEVWIPQVKRNNYFLIKSENQRNLLNYSVLPVYYRHQ